MLEQHCQLAAHSSPAFLQSAAILRLAPRTDAAGVELIDAPVFISVAVQGAAQSVTMATAMVRMRIILASNN
jgi:hypothetical protein